MSQIVSMPAPANAAATAEPMIGNPARTVTELRAMSFRGLARMYIPEEREFYFRLRATANGIVPEGRSRRYAAIALIGLATEKPHDCAVALRGHTPLVACSRLAQDVATVTNLGDVALSSWAAHLLGSPDRDHIWRRLVELASPDVAQPTVEVSWALTAACLQKDLDKNGLAHKLAARLMNAFPRNSRVFPHVLGASRAQVACYADMVYPIQALSYYHMLSSDPKALEIATQAAARIVEAQGPEGQWWWHYDVRSGRVIEGYPVYAIHQDAMGPMALFALRDAGGPDHSAAIRKGLDWLYHSPEIDGSLIDPHADIIWRKVWRREPGKFSRYAQAAASYLHPSIRIPGLNALFPPKSIDAENRPYHLGWLLHAWPAARAAAWDRKTRGA